MPALRRSTVRPAIKAALDGSASLVLGDGTTRITVVIDRRRRDDTKTIEDKLRDDGIVITVPPASLSTAGDSLRGRAIEFLQGGIHIRTNEKVNVGKPVPLDLDVVVERVQAALLVAQDGALEGLSLGNGESLTVDMPDDEGCATVALLYTAKLVPVSAA